MDIIVPRLLLEVEFSECNMAGESSWSSANIDALKSQIMSAYVAKSVLAVVNFLFFPDLVI